MNFFVPPQPLEGNKKKKKEEMELKLKEKIQYPSKYLSFFFLNTFCFCHKSYTGYWLRSRSSLWQSEMIRLLSTVIQGCMLETNDPHFKRKVTSSDLWATELHVTRDCCKRGC